MENFFNLSFKQFYEIQIMIVLNFYELIKENFEYILLMLQSKLNTLICKILVRI